MPSLPTTDMSMTWVRHEYDMSTTWVRHEYDMEQLLYAYLEIKAIREMHPFPWLGQLFHSSAVTYMDVRSWHFLTSMWVIFTPCGTGVRKLLQVPYQMHVRFLTTLMMNSDNTIIRYVAQNGISCANTIISSNISHIQRNTGISKTDVKLFM